MSVLDDECEDITSAEELSICYWRLVNGRPEHFLTMRHILALDPAGISKAMSSFPESKIGLHKLVVQGYDSAATIAGEHFGVQTTI